MRSTKREQGTLILMMAFGFVTGAAVCGAQQPSPATTTATPPGPAAAAQPAPAAEVAPPPAEAPVTPPKVVCGGNQLSISAANSTLSSVLDEVHRCLGSHIDIPDSAGSKRIFDKIGPGPASQVLDELLSNTGYNYIIGASPDNDEKIESIVLLSRSGDAVTSTSVVEDSRAGSTSHRLFMQMHQNSVPHPMTEQDEAAAAALGKSTETAPATTPAEATKPAEGTAPAAAPADGQQTPAAPAPDTTTKPADTTPASADPATTPASNANNYSTHPNTTEQQIVNMQQMFELRKQMQQQQNTPPAPPQN